MENSDKTQLTVLYVGADGSWDDIRRSGFRRRNTCLLKALAVHSEVSALYVVRPVPWADKSVGCFMLHDLPGSKVRDLFLPLLPGSARSAWVRRLNDLLWRVILLRKGINASSERTCLFAYWPDGLRTALKLAGTAPILFDADHNIVDDVNFDATEREEIRSLLAECGRRGGVVGIAAARSMLDYFTSVGIPSFRLRNGVDPDRFPVSSPCPAELRELPRPIIGYVGTLSRWLYLEMLGELARRRPGWSFVVIGAAYKRDLPGNVSGCRNIVFVGEKGADEVPGYLAHFDCALNLYRCDSPEWMDPDSMKLFEYLAAGVPVVSTPFHPALYDDFEGLVRTAGDLDGILEGIDTVVALSEEERVSWKIRARQFAEENTWQSRGDEVVSLCRNPARITGVKVRS